ncbi:MAG TPA: rubredoxin, partial [Chitinophagaceae bacterium]|nr:rubredoxin [Chitinophagaceae bacterium]
MFRKQPVLKVNLPGGIVSAGDLYALALAAEAAGVEQVQLGNRQQLFLKVSERESAAIGTRLNEAGLFYEDGTDQFPNLLSSYVAEGVFDGSGWLSEGLYKDILDAFTYRPRLKINLVDGTQTFVPFFTGNLNFISAPVNNYWYLYVRFPKSEIMYRWKGLVYSQDIPRISRLIEHSVYHNRDL